MSARACGVSLNMPNRSPAPSTAPAYWLLMSGNGKKSKSPSLAPPCFLKKSVMKLAWWWKMQPGGVLNSWLPPSPKFVELIAFGPPYDSETTLPNVSNAVLISGDVHVCVPATHLS